MQAIPQEAIYAVVALWVFVMAVLGWLREQKQWQYAQMFVRAADQMLAEQPGNAKLDWVTTQLATIFPKLDAARMRAMIEAALDLKRNAQQ
jgi:hypothetical protein